MQESSGLESPSKNFSPVQNKSYKNVKSLTWFTLFTNGGVEGSAVWGSTSNCGHRMKWSSLFVRQDSNKRPEMMHCQLSNCCHKKRLTKMPQTIHHHKK